MTSELSKTISTCTVWLATAVIFTFGLFRMNGDFLFFVVAIVTIAGAAAGATAVIWQPGKPSPASRDDSPRI